MSEVLSNSQYKQCPFCAEDIKADAIKCKHCGEMLDGAKKSAPKVKKWDKGVAILISLFLPGFGHIYKGKVGAGLLWFLFSVLGYAMFVVPGVFIHILALLAAGSGDEYK